MSIGEEMTKPLHDNRNDTATEMVRFLERWAPFGGGDEEIFPTFGVNPSVFYSRLAQSLRADPALVARDAEKLIAYCIRRAGSPSEAGAR